MKGSFAPRARLISVLGAQLIKDDVVGLLELVKNGYDADATEVVVSVLNTQDPTATEISVIDNGTGMSLATIMDHWLQPASGHKELKKKKLQRSSLGRLPQGEKGVGRFAVHRLGKQFTMVTRTRDESLETVVTIDWSVFDDDSKSLADVEFDIIRREPEIFAGKSGTLLVLREARFRWQEKDVRKLQKGLERMMSPFKGAQDFLIRLVCPDYPQYEKLDPADITRHAHFEFDGIVDESGNLIYNYRFKLPSYEPREIVGREVFLPALIDGWGDISRGPVCGPFSLQVCGWNRYGTYMALTPEVTKTNLDSRCGVSVYRDGIRVLPYGEEGNDWLDIDKERINDPSKRLANKNVIGLIELNQIDNPHLKDKTNREGFVENEAYWDLQALVYACIQRLEQEYLPDRTPLNPNMKKDRREDTKTKVEQVRQALTSLVEGADNRQAEPIPNKPSQETPPTPAGPTIDQEKLSRTIETARNAFAAIQEHQEAYEQESQILLSLAGLGFTAERFSHEFSRLLGKAEDSLARIRKRLPTNDSDVLALSAALDALRTDLQGLGPLLYVRRKKNQSTSVRAALNNALLLNEHLARDQRIELRGQLTEDFSVKLSEGALTQVLNNLIDNAIHWCTRHPQGGKREIAIRVFAETGTILVEDSGPGVPDHLKVGIFEPFVSNRTEGRGLGLWIVRQILTQDKCVIRLLDSDDPLKNLRGAGFLLNLAPAKSE